MSGTKRSKKKRKTSKSPLIEYCPAPPKNGGVWARWVKGKKANKLDEDVGGNCFRLVRICASSGAAHHLRGN